MQDSTISGAGKGLYATTAHDAHETIGFFWGVYKLFACDDDALRFSRRCVRVLSDAQVRSVLLDGEGLGSGKPKLYLDVAMECPAGYVNSAGSLVEPTAAVVVAFRQPHQDEERSAQFYSSQLGKLGCVALQLLHSVEAGDEVFVRY